MGIHRNLKALRVKKGLYQKDLAEHLGLDISSYNLKENGKRDFTMSEIEKIKKIFNLSYEEIFFNEEVPELRTS